jgi:DNA-nicking Smr family endonuclease
MARKRSLRPEERALWRKIAKSVTPIDEARLKSIEEDVEATRPAKPAKPEGKPTPRSRVRSPKPERRPEVTPVDRGGERRHRRGKIEIEAKLDLHGLTQDSAHAALRGFIQTAHFHRMRTVLVITGKGFKTHKRDAEPWEYVEEVGVLRRRLPQWLGSAELRVMVSGYSAAHVRHGGEGAFYVTLRRH